MISFREYLIEEKTDDKAHFTSLKSLLSILKDGELKGKRYSWDKSSISRTKITQEAANKNLNDSKFELCLIRKANNRNISVIAMEDPEVKIIFDWDNIKNLRGIKKPYPIAEMIISIKDILSQLVDGLIKKKLLNPEDKERMMKLLLNPGTEKENQIQEKILEEFPNLNKKNLGNIVWEAARRQYFIYNREGEERIDLTKNNIPVSSKYMKIILPKNITRLSSLSNGISDKQKQEEEVQKLISLIEQYKKKDPELFEFKEMAK